MLTVHIDELMLNNWVIKYDEVYHKIPSVIKIKKLCELEYGYYSIPLTKKILDKLILWGTDFEFKLIKVI